MRSLKGNAFFSRKQREERGSEAMDIEIEGVSLHRESEACWHAIWFSVQ